ncbi:OmpA family protein [Paraglaciecola aestuariivivens]
MAQSPNPDAKNHDQAQMHKLRELVLGVDGFYVKQIFQHHSRELLADKISEALKDRESQDGTVNKVLVPIVEKSVEHSITVHSEQFVSSMYPIMGKLVRKSVSAFIAELLEKTNTLLENSLTIKGLSWRIKAKQSGVSFSQYAASQTFDYRVEQVFLIHSETGLLLNSVSLGIDTQADADLISSMLVAINDFVSDSFRQNQTNDDQTLDVVQTDNFTLLLKQGPKAFVVAAITGNMPQKVGNKLQKTVEDIHKIYEQELKDFNGDITPFADSEDQLRDCLMAELKQEAQKKKRRPWLAYLLLSSFLIGISYIAVKKWQTHELLQKLALIEQTPGILITQLDSQGLDKVFLGVMRDPNAPTVQSWLTARNLDSNKITIKETAFLSLDPSLIQQKTTEIVATYDDLEVLWSEGKPLFYGNLSRTEKWQLEQQLSNLLGLNFSLQWLDNIKIKEPENAQAKNPQILKSLMNMHIAELEQINLGFEPNNSDLSPSALEQLIRVKTLFEQIVALADQQNLSIGLIIIGASDALGSTSHNKTLSQKRADNAKLKLQQLGLQANRLNSVGLGAITLAKRTEGVRKVLFNVVYFENE